MRRRSLFAASVALSVASSAALAGDSSPAAPAAGAKSAAESLADRLVHARATERAKADADLSTADRETAVAVARILRDRYGPPPARIAQSRACITAIAFPEGFRVGGESGRLVAVLHAHPIDFGPEVVGMVVRDFDVSFGDPPPPPVAPGR